MISKAEGTHVRGFATGTGTRKGGHSGKLFEFVKFSGKVFVVHNLENTRQVN